MKESIMVKRTTIRKIANASLAFLVSVLPIASAMDSSKPEEIIPSNTGRLRDCNYYKEELQKLEESTARIHAEVDRILKDFRCNMEQYYLHARTTSAATTTTSKAGTAAKTIGKKEFDLNFMSGGTPLSPREAPCYTIQKSSQVLTGDLTQRKETYQSVEETKELKELGYPSTRGAHSTPLNIVDIQQEVQKFRDIQMALIDEEFAKNRRITEENLTHSGRSGGSFANDLRTRLTKQEALARQQGDMRALAFGEDLAQRRLNRNIQIFNLLSNIQETERRERILPFYMDRDKEKFEIEAALYRKAADQGDSYAQSMLGWMYQSGQGAKQSDLEAVIWYRKAANQGDSYAQFMLGNMYKNGLGVKQNNEEAVIWYRKAANQGDAKAQFMLGVMYHTGQGVKKSDAEAAVWCRKAADQGNTKAQFNLGNMYKNGLGVKKSNTEAMVWYRKAADQGDAEAQFAINQLK